MKNRDVLKMTDVFICIAQILDIFSKSWLFKFNLFIPRISVELKNIDTIVGDVWKIGELQCCVSCVFNESYKQAKHAKVGKY